LNESFVGDAVYLDLVKALLGDKFRVELDFNGETLLTVLSGLLLLLWAFIQMPNNQITSVKLLVLN